MTNLRPRISRRTTAVRLLSRNRFIASNRLTTSNHASPGEVPVDRDVMIVAPVCVTGRDRRHQRELLLAAQTNLADFRPTLADARKPAREGSSWDRRHAPRPHSPTTRLDDESSAISSSFTFGQATRRACASRTDDRFRVWLSRQCQCRRRIVSRCRGPDTFLRTRCDTTILSHGALGVVSNVYPWRWHHGVVRLWGHLPRW